VREGSNIPILMLSARGATPDRVYVRVKAILRHTLRPRRRARRAVSSAHADLVIDLDRHEVRRGGDHIALSTAEFRLFVALVEAGGRVTSPA
jgi:DNA-binding response OmpR family regulator